MGENALEEELRLCRERAKRGIAREKRLEAEVASLRKQLKVGQTSNDTA